MTLITCPECENKLSDTANECPKCGCHLTEEKIAEIKKKGQLVRKGCSIGCLSVIVFFVLIACFSSSNSSSGSNSSSSPREVVTNSAWDGSVSQVKSWLKAYLKDPGSLEFIEWSSVSKSKAGGFMVRVKYRAKSSFGGYVVSNKVFSLNSAGTVTSYTDY